jgi:hypothetical protein
LFPRIRECASGATEADLAARELSQVMHARRRYEKQIAFALAIFRVPELDP